MVWKQTKVTIGDVLAEQAMVEHHDKVLEWPVPLPLNTEVTLSVPLKVDGQMTAAEQTLYVGDCRACGGQFQIELMREQRLPAPQEARPQAVQAALAAEAAAEQPAAEQPAPEVTSKTRKGTKP